MEKLIELLNECKPTVSCANFKEHYEFIDDDIYLIREWMDGEEEQFHMYVCYKKGDFIKWLVENDKIDFEWMSWNWKLISYLTDEKDYKWNDIKEWVVLMLLSISDTPIKDLISYLK